MTLYDLNTEALSKRGEIVRAEIDEFFAEARRRREWESKPPPPVKNPIFDLLDAYYFWRR